MELEADYLAVIKEMHSLTGFRITVLDSAFRPAAACPDKSLPEGGFPAEGHIPVLRAVSETDHTALWQCSCGSRGSAAALIHHGVPAGYVLVESAVPQTQKNVRHHTSFELLRHGRERFASGLSAQAVSCAQVLKITAKYTVFENTALEKRDLAFEVRRYLRGNYRRPLTIAVLCEHFMCSKSTLMNAFRRKYQKTVNQYLNDVRLEHAVHLLETTDLPVYEVAFRCGYSDQNYFSKVFGKEHGMPPSSYREKWQELSSE